MQIKRKNNKKPVQIRVHSKRLHTITQKDYTPSLKKTTHHHSKRLHAITQKDYTPSLKKTTHYHSKYYEHGRYNSKVNECECSQLADYQLQSGRQNLYWLKSITLRLCIYSMLQYSQILLFLDSFQPREVQFRSSSNKTIEASWKRPKLFKRKLKGFKLLLKNTDTSQLQSIPFNKQKDSYFFKFTKLVPNTEYNLEISAEYDDSGVGKPVKATLTTFEPSKYHFNYSYLQS